MKIIKDKNLIEHRVALQELLIGQTAVFAEYVDKIKELAPENTLAPTELENGLRKKIQSIALMYYELQYGNFFYKQTPEFRNLTINIVVQQFKTIIINKTLTTQNEAAYLIFPYLEKALQQEIKGLNNASK